ncbi:MAG: galactokinase [Dermatophilaceae bacterium]
MDAVVAFRDAFGGEPAGVWSAPGRVNLIGEHTDYNGGLALPVALPQRTYAAASPRGDRLLRVTSVQTGDLAVVRLDEVAPGAVGGWSAYVAGVPWALEQAGYAISGLDVAIDGRVPLGAGLSSSAALECAVGAALSDLCGLGLLASDAGRGELVTACRRAENEIAGAPTGGMDQSASLMCRADHALLLDCRDGHTEQVPFALGDAGLALLVIDTRAHHALVDGQYGARRASCEAAARTLGVETLREIDGADLGAALGRLADDIERRRVRHVVTEIDRVVATVTALRAGAYAEVGRLFDASHASLRDDYEVSCPELDVAVAVARGAGALGARMTGGGFGGSAIALVPVESVSAVVAAVEKEFSDNDFDAPACFPVTASTGAARDW